MPEQDSPQQPSIEEVCLLRLFRLLDNRTREDLVARVLGAALRLPGAWIDPIGDEQEEALEGALWSKSPLDWPQCQIVDLDNLGDPGIWVQNGPGEPWASILFTSTRDEYWAEQLADDYAERVIELGVSMPSDFDEEDYDGDYPTDKDLAALQADFVGFLVEWRERVMRIAEKSSEAPPDQSAP